MKTTKTTQIIALLSFLFLFPVTSFSQIADSFSDGDFLNNPTWIGDTNHFLINSSYQLQLHATLAGTSFLALPTNWNEEEKEWKFVIQLPFSPSTNNCAQVILKSDNRNLTQMSQGYYLQFGENLATDAIELFYKNGTQLISVCRGQNGYISNPFSLNIKVTYSNSGEWKIYTDSSNTGAFQIHSEGFSFDSLQMEGFGVLCKYTSSNLDKFYFDNFYYGPPIIDISPPEVVSIKTDDFRDKILITFSEYPSPITVLNKENYILNSTIIPDSVYYDSQNENSIILQFYTPFENYCSYPFTIQKIEDISGNEMVAYHHTVSFYSIEKYDLLITEIMADPTPQILLPPGEYIEICNVNGPDTAFLKDWSLKIGNTLKLLPEMKIPKNKFALLCSNSYLSEFQYYSDNVYGLSSLSLTNDGQELCLINARNEVIHYVRYSINWHTDPIKMDGGWSLEMKDLNNPCSGAENWGSSTSNQGGTPGNENSILQENPDLNPPDIEKVIVKDIITLLLYFSESIHFSTIPFQIDHNIDIAHTQFIDPNQQIVQLELFDPILENTIYTLTIKDSILDCCNNLIPINRVIKFAIPESPVKGDIVINEILTNSFGETEADYVELYNRSSKIIDVGKMRIGMGTNGIPEKLVLISGSGFLLFPNQYVAVCKNKKLTALQYLIPNEINLLETDSIPNFTNSSGTIFFTDFSLNMMDQITYSEEFHSPYLFNYDGVSLEKIDYNLIENKPEYWQSASYSVGYGTPGYQNSNYVDHNISEEEISITPNLMSPNGDGIDDLLEIITHFSDEETRITIKIFNIQGNLVNEICNNDIVTSNEVFIWNGYNAIGEKVADGFYIAKIEYWNLNGIKKQLKKGISLIH